MPVIVQCMGSASGARLGVEGQWLKGYDLERHGGIGWVDFTKDRAQAMRFDDLAAFHAVYKSSPKCKPIREDGRPNRPLTATNWNIETVA